MATGGIRDIVENIDMIGDEIRNARSNNAMKKNKAKPSVAKSKRTGIFYMGLLIFLVSLPLGREQLYVYDFKLSGYGQAVALSLGVLMMLYGLLYKTPENKQNNPTYVDMICPKCLKTFLAGTIEKDVCPQCACELEPLTGFYDRHPELKSIREKRPVPKKRIN